MIQGEPREISNNYPRHSNDLMHAVQGRDFS